MKIFFKICLIGSVLAASLSAAPPKKPIPVRGIDVVLPAISSPWGAGDPFEERSQVRRKPSLLATALYQELLLWGDLYHDAALRKQGVLMRQELFSPLHNSAYDDNSDSLIFMSPDGQHLGTFNPEDQRLTLKTFGGQEVFSKTLSIPQDKHFHNPTFWGGKVFFLVGQIHVGQRVSEDAVPGTPWMLDPATGEEKPLLDPQRYLAAYRVNKRSSSKTHFFITAVPVYERMHGVLDTHLMRYNNESQAFDFIRAIDEDMHDFVFDDQGAPLTARHATWSEKGLTENFYDLCDGKEAICHSISSAEQHKQSAFYCFAPSASNLLDRKDNPDRVILMDSKSTNYKVPLVHDFGEDITTPLLNQIEMDALTGDVSDLIFAWEAGPPRVSAYRTAGITPEWVWRDPKEVGCRAMRELEAYARSHELGEPSLGHTVFLTEDRARSLVSFHRPDAPTHFHVFDLNLNASLWEDVLHFIGAHAPTLPRAHLQERLCPMVRFTYTTSDGLTIPAYVSLPRGRALGDGGPRIPLINHIHGGPHARDTWAFNPELQFYASRGCAVFSAQFRGSEGFGGVFWDASDGHWDKAVRDTHEGVKYLLQTEDIFDPNRVAVMGHSFGGYGTAFSLLAYPETYTCGIALNGVYDLPLLAEEGKNGIAQMSYDQVIQQLGGDPDRPEIRRAMEQKSPVHLASSSTFLAPLLLMHAGQDDISAPEHAPRLAQALPPSTRVTFVMFPEEDHCLSDPQTHNAAMALREAFLGQHLGLPVQSGVRHEVGNAQVANKLIFVSGEEYLNPLP